MFRSLLRNPDFRLRFADRGQKHYFNGGALSDQNIFRLHAELRDIMKGVFPKMNPYIEERWIPNRRTVVMRQMASVGIQRSENAPHFSPHGGQVPVGYRLDVTTSVGQVYYTLDGADPGQPILSLTWPMPTKPQFSLTDRSPSRPVLEPTTDGVL